MVYFDFELDLLRINNFDLKIVTVILKRDAAENKNAPNLKGFTSQKSKITKPFFNHSTPLFILDIKNLTFIYLFQKITSKLHLITYTIVIGSQEHK